VSGALTIGKFDALHIGHFALIESAATFGQPTIVSFSEMAAELGWPERLPLLTVAERDRVLQQWSQKLGQDILKIEIPFVDVRFLEPAAFIEYLNKHHPFVAIVTGENFRFSYKRSGDIKTLNALASEYSFSCKTVAGVAAAGDLVSSSRIRQAISQGQCQLAAVLMGRPYVTEGRVQRGDGRGRQLGFATANIQDIGNLIPASGVYAARVSIDGAGAMAAAINIGHLPSIGDDRPLSVEAHIIDWSGDCYDKIMRIEWQERLRDEQKFASLDDLKIQIAEDIVQAAQILK